MTTRTYRIKLSRPQETVVDLVIGPIPAYYRQKVLAETGKDPTALVEVRDQYLYVPRDADVCRWVVERLESPIADNQLGIAARRVADKIRAVAELERP